MKNLLKTTIPVRNLLCGSSKKVGGRGWKILFAGSLAKLFLLSFRDGPTFVWSPQNSDLFHELVMFVPLTRELSRLHLNALTFIIG